MTHCGTVDTVSKLSDLRKATQTCTGNSNLHINYVSMELRQMSVETRQNSQAVAPEFPLTPPRRELLKQDKERVKLGMFQRESPLLHHQSSSAVLEGYPQHCFCVSGRLELARRRAQSGGEGPIKEFRDLPSCLLPFSSPSDHFLTERALK